MKKHLITLLISSISLSLYSQSAIWTKDDRNNIYDDCMSYITKYNFTTKEQKESISLCYISEVTKKYTKLEFQAMIDIEVKRIKESVIDQCAKNIGVDLKIQQNKEDLEQKKVGQIKKNIPTKSGLVGKWKTADNATLEFKDDGSYIKKYLKHSPHLFIDGKIDYIYDDIIQGDWFLDDKGNLTLVMNWKVEKGVFTVKVQNFTFTDELKFLSYTEDYIKFQSTISGFEPEQANRIKD